MTPLNTIIEEETLNEIANTVYVPFDTTMPGAIHTYGQIPGLNATVKKHLTTAMQRAYEAGQKEGRESLIKMFSVAIEADIKTAQKINVPIMVAGKALVETLRRTELDAVIEKIKQ